MKTVRKGLFRRDKSSGVSYILRGLRLKAEGVGNHAAKVHTVRTSIDVALTDTNDAIAAHGAEA